jgi:hypothetical protein
VGPFTNCLINHLEVTGRSGERTAEVLSRDGILELTRQKREKAQRNQQGMHLYDDGRTLGNLENGLTALLQAVGHVKAKGGPCSQPRSR